MINHQRRQERKEQKKRVFGSHDSRRFKPFRSTQAGAPQNALFESAHDTQCKTKSSALSASLWFALLFSFLGALCALAVQKSSPGVTHGLRAPSVDERAVDDYCGDSDRGVSEEQVRRMRQRAMQLQSEISAQSGRRCRNERRAGHSVRVAVERSQ